MELGKVKVGRAGDSIIYIGFQEEGSIKSKSRDDIQNGETIKVCYPIQPFLVIIRVLRKCS